MLLNIIYQQETENQLKTAIYDGAIMALTRFMNILKVEI